MGTSQQTNQHHFKTMPQVDVPQGRKGKHSKIVSAILDELDQLKDGAALKVPLSELEDTMANVRSALNRATRKQKREVATATDENFFYVWNTRRLKDNSHEEVRS